MLSSPSLVSLLLLSSSYIHEFESLIVFVCSFQDAESIKRAQKAIIDLKDELEGLQKVTDFLNKENEDRTKDIEVISVISCDVSLLRLNISTNRKFCFFRGFLWDANSHSIVIRPLVHDFTPL